MKKRFSMIILCILFISVILFSEEKELNIYVSKKGNDSWTGKLAEPNKDNTDGPLATPYKANEIVKNLKENKYSKIIINIREGEYQIKNTIRIQNNFKSGNEYKIIWKAYNDEIVYFTGSEKINGFNSIKDENVLKQINDSLKNKILITDLKSQNIIEYGSLPSTVELAFKGKIMTISRYPNNGWLLIDDVPQSGEKLFNKGDAKVIRFGHPAGKHYGKLICADPEIKKWKESNNIWIHGYLCWDWKDAYQRIEKINPEFNEIIPAEPHHWYGYEKGQRYYFLNILEELDTPGEYYLDNKNGLLYFYPPSKIMEGDASITILNEPMFHLLNTKDVSFENIYFENSRARVIQIDSGTGNRIAGCTIRNIGADTSIVINGGMNNGILSSDVYDVGSAGCYIRGGDKKSLEKGENYVINSHFYRFGRIIRAFNGAIWVSGVGNKILHNKIHNAAFSGIQFYGNEHLIEYNEVYDIAHEAGDIGGTNTGADYSDMGTIIRYNYFHHTTGPGTGGFRAVYLDLPGSNTTIYGNLFYKVDIGVFFNSGRDNKVLNNIFINCSTAVNIYVWPHKQYFYKGGAWKIWEKLMDIDYKNPPYSTRYPILPRYLDSTDLGMPYGHLISNNISYGGIWLDLSEEMEYNKIKVENNLIASPKILVLTKKFSPDYDPYKIGYAAEYNFGDEPITTRYKKDNNILMNSDPGFIDFNKENFDLKSNSPAFKLGFKKIPIEKMGLYKDEFRKKKE